MNNEDMDNFVLILQKLRPQQQCRFIQGTCTQIIFKLPADQQLLTMMRLGDVIRRIYVTQQHH